MYDLHLHTTCSDGALTPRELLDRAAASSLCVIAITDHNTTAGVEDAYRWAQQGSYPVIIPGVELSTSSPRVHILGYGMEIASPGLQCELARIRRAQRCSLRATVDKLRRQSLNIAWERVLELAGGGTVGRRHVALALREAGHVVSIDEAFARYLGDHGSAHTPMAGCPSPCQAIDLITAAGGVACLAHPLTVPALDGLLTALRYTDLFGLEVYCSTYNGGTVRRLRRLASAHGLLPLGGSDFHDPSDQRVSEVGGSGLPAASIQTLLEASVMRKQRRAR